MAKMTRKQKQAAGAATAGLLAMAAARLTFGLLFHSTPLTYYVSPSSSCTGSGCDGTTWAKAWKLPQAIDWLVLNPGDVVELDGGPLSNACAPVENETSTCGVRYNGFLSVGKSGGLVSGVPHYITVKLSSEAGRNGTAVLDGGVTNHTYCSGATDIPGRVGPTNGGTIYATGINYNSHSYISVDGTKWGGIVVRNFQFRGAYFRGGTNNTLRFTKIHHITTSTGRAVGIGTDYPSANILIDRVEIGWPHQDIFDWSSTNSTIRNSYFHNAHCQHSDGIQGFIPTNNPDVPANAGKIDNMVVRDNIFYLIISPGGDGHKGQHAFLGECCVHDSWWENAHIHDNIFWEGWTGTDTTSRFITTKNPKSKNFLMEYNTFVGKTLNGGEVINWSGGGVTAPMNFSNNIVYQGATGFVAFRMDTAGGDTVLSNNCLYDTGSRTGDFSESGTITGNPLFVNTGGDFSLQAGSPCAGKGARNHQSVAELIAAVGEGTPSPTPSPITPSPTHTRTPTATSTGVLPTSTRTPTLTPTRTSTPTIVPTVFTPVFGATRTPTFTPSMIPTCAFCTPHPTPTPP